MNSSSEITHGAMANKTGNSLEKYVKDQLEANGYTPFPLQYKKQLLENRKSIGGKQYATQAPVGDSIYGSKRNCDFFVINPDKFPEGLVIECKWQQVAGSVDEKYPFLYFNIVKTGVPTIVLLDGGGCKKSAKEWLKGMAHKEKALVAVWDMAEFQKQVNNGFLG
ncbi:MAG: PD-(D/E)XK nuclease superfamily protein [bacterium]